MTFVIRASIALSRLHPGIGPFPIEFRNEEVDRESYSASVGRRHSCECELLCAIQAD